MTAWMVFSIVALLFFIAEIYVPTIFFLNFSIAALICAILGFATENYDILIPIFAVLSVVFILFLRPMLNLNQNKMKKNEFESQYIGKQATAITNINAFTGRIKIYDEDWEARTTDEDEAEIKKGAKVTILHHDDLTMYVQKKGRK